MKYEKPILQVMRHDDLAIQILQTRSNGSTGTIHINMDQVNLLIEDLQACQKAAVYEQERQNALQRLMVAHRAGIRINAIKAIRDLTTITYEGQPSRPAIGLRDAKEIYEALAGLIPIIPVPAA